MLENSLFSGAGRQLHRRCRGKLILQLHGKQFFVVRQGLLSLHGKHFFISGGKQIYRRGKVKITGFLEAPVRSSSSIVPDKWEAQFRS